jgi:hypothetical protein
MPERPAFLHELDVRGHALLNIALVLFGLGLLVGATLAIRVTRESPMWWFMLALIAVWPVAICAILFVPLAYRGGKYRVVIQDGRLRIESPHWIFGESFELPLSEIAQLVVRNKESSRHLHGIRAIDGTVYQLDASFSGRRHIEAEQLFAVIRRLRPEIPIVEKR